MHSPCPASAPGFRRAQACFVQKLTPRESRAAATGGEVLGYEGWAEMARAPSATAATAELLIVPSERQLEAALRAGAPRVTTQSALESRALALAGHRAATRAERLLATTAALETQGVRGQHAVALAAEVDTLAGRAGRSGPRQPPPLPAPRENFTPALALARKLLLDAGVVDGRTAPYLVTGNHLAEANAGVNKPTPSRVRGKLRFDDADLLLYEKLALAGPVVIELPRLDHPALMGLAGALERRWADTAQAPSLEWIEPSPIQWAGASQAATRSALGRAVARAACNALASGVSAERIAILVPSLNDRFIQPIVEALRDAELPFWTPRNRGPLDFAEGAWVETLLEMASGEILRDKMVDLLRSPVAHLGLITSDADEGTAASRAGELARRLSDVSMSIERGGLLRDEFASSLPPHAAWMAEAFDRFVGLAERISQTTDRRGLTQKLESTLQELRIGSPSSALLREAFQHENQHVDALAYGSRAAAEILRALRALRDASERLNVRTTPRPSDVQQELHALLAPLPPLPAARAGRLALAEPRAHLGVGIDVAIVAFATDVGYQRHNEDEEGGAESVELTLSAALRDVAQCFAVAHLDQPGTSEWILGSGVDLTTSGREEPVSPLDLRATRIGRRGARLHAILSGDVPEAIFRSAQREHARTAFFLDAAAPELFLESPSVTDHVASLLGGMSPTDTISVSAVDDAVRCAFRVVARRVLGVRAPTSRSEIMDPAGRGTLLHHALHAVFVAAGELLPGASQDERTQACRRRAEQALHMSDARSIIYREYAELAISRALEVLELGCAPGMSFGYGEHTFGAQGPWPALRLAGVAAPHFVDGQIDRIDVGPTRLRVIDYKTGTIDRDSVQLALYERATAENLPGRAVVAEYLQIADANFTFVPARKEGQDEHAVLAIASTALDRVRSGCITPRPSRPSICDHCFAKTVCRIPHVALHTSATDPASLAEDP